MPAVAACRHDSPPLALAGAPHADRLSAAVHQPRRPERTVAYQAVQGHLETWLHLARSSEPDGDPVPAHVEREFRQYLTCGILAHGFARARGADCGHDFLIAF
jgi:hypothetical protein